VKGEIGEGNCVFQLCNCVNGGLLIREGICSLDGTVEILGGCWVQEENSHLSHYHRMSGLVKTCEESLNTCVVLILKPNTATPKHVPHCGALVPNIQILNTPPQAMNNANRTPLKFTSP